ncbi:hypothetical protein [Streptomyces doebereineriae]|uniref:Cytochrome P450 n=1 Tax=Streptomyces doebereineriae TaxID=3075528 RepID=A0ABU2VGK6_9ACTN|nr:hypothetical protein [Streptomyces sp. DSM 41640]MDT0484514.1 hypothetical protein [Streptomyces sp. DSM 41640]
MSTSTLGRFVLGRGPHVCPGAPSARRDVGIAVSYWLERFPDARLVL